MREWIYIPVWCDLNMISPVVSSANSTFTFQYGAIWIGNVHMYAHLSQPHVHSSMVRFEFRIKSHFLTSLVDLHSSMVRFELPSSTIEEYKELSFTFQYGAIWIFQVCKLLKSRLHLHSSMVRFELKHFSKYTCD